VGRLRRLDAELVRRGLARSREHAGELVGTGRVTVAGAIAHKSATQVDPAVPIVVVPDDTDPGYASRGGHKLAGALDAFATGGEGSAGEGSAGEGSGCEGSARGAGGCAPGCLVVEGRHALDAGASTGGFTDVLLRRGAARVVAVDVGYGQLVWSLRNDPRVIVLDRQNVRELNPGLLPYRPDLVVGDLSFISLRLVLPALLACAAPAADLVLMVKPQFEVGRERLGVGGVVRDPAQRAEAVASVAGAATALGLGVAGVVASPLPGPSGNVEYFLWLRAGAPPLNAGRLTAAIEKGPR
jgi:23S rRNA (cytidine1920-2'-O)/16S rRNA (cytidine1409-2'-O)-methyltransferase